MKKKLLFSVGFAYSWPIALLQAGLLVASGAGIVQAANPAFSAGVGKYVRADQPISGKITDEKGEGLLGGVTKLTNAFATANGLNLRDEIRRERRVELAQEGFRYWDLIRWKTAEIELPKPILGNYFFKAEFGTVAAVRLTPDNYILVQEASFRRFDPNRDYLWPLPINEIALTHR